MSLTYDGCSVHDVVAADVFSRLYLVQKIDNVFTFVFLHWENIYLNRYIDHTPTDARE